MINYLLTLTLILEPLLPANIPPNWIYMGSKVKPIQAIKVEPNFKVEFYGALLNINDFLRVKSVIENAPDVCTYAIDEAVEECKKGRDRSLTIAFNREDDIRQTLKAYEVRLAKTEELLIEEQFKTKIFMYSTMSLGVISVASITTFFIWSR
jgi:hypothetical protein